MARKAKEPDSPEIVVEILERGQYTFHILGLSPVIFNAVSQKSGRELLFPAPKKTAAEKATTLKHDPVAEYFNSTYRRRAQETGPTRLLLKSSMFKKGVSEVAKRVPGSATTAAVKQLVWAEGDYLDLYGIPELYMTIVRNSDQNHTPDIRTRAVVPQWACKVKFTFIRPQVTLDAMTRLLMSAGMIQGVGDGRQEKGAYNFGQYELVNDDDPRWLAIVKNGGLKEQDLALAHPQCYDQDSEEMLTWFQQEVERREMATKNKPIKVGRRKKGNGEEQATA